MMHSVPALLYPTEIVGEKAKSANGNRLRSDWELPFAGRGSICAVLQKAADHTGDVVYGRAIMVAVEQPG